MAKDVALPSTAEQARRVLNVARDRGVDRVQALHEAGLLWSPEREHDIRVLALSEAAARLDEISVDQLAGRGRVLATAADTKRAVAQWLGVDAYLYPKGQS